MKPTTRFLSVDDVLKLHAFAIKDQGGDPSIRDLGLLQSAVATPAQQFGGQYLHEDIPAMAAAYAFHICMNHAFVDGNKRAATAAMIIFLSDNGWSFDATADEAEPVILQLAAGSLDKPALTEWVRKHTHEKPNMELRDFFQKLTWEQIHQMAGGVSASGSETEAQATTNEAILAIPLISLLDEYSKAAKDASEEKPRIYFRSMSILLTAIYRVAEDMGYEW